MSRITNKIGVISLGCPKATVDMEHILSRLRSEGYDLSSSYSEAELVIVNTCGFIEEAVVESLETIGEALAENGKVIVTGCLGAREALIREHCPQVLAITGPDALEEVMTAVHEHLPPSHDPRLDLLPPGGLKLTPRHYAYLKIAEGCNQQCSFCVIPGLRGRLVSRPPGEILDEAERLVGAGVKELLIVAQDTAAYGVDVKYRTGFWQGRPVATRIGELVRQLGSLPAWIRLHYVYPYPHVDQLVALMAQGLILPYLDVPLQHASPPILKAMRRPANSENLLKRIAEWRETCPNLSLRSTFIVGFPGETEADFQRLLDFLAEARLDRVGAFPYSPVDGAAANALPDPVPEQLKQERLARLMALQEGISREKLRARRGQRFEVLVDDADEDWVYARGPGEAPEIDGLVLLPPDTEVDIGEFLKVEITDSDEHDLYARPN